MKINEPQIVECINHSTNVIIAKAVNVFNMNYISLFSSAGVGCYGFKQEGYDCVASVELLEKRLKIQKANNKVKYNQGYVLGDITETNTKKQLYNAIKLYQQKEDNKDIDVIIFTAPCQSMSVANHKKKTIEKNSLVVEALEITKKIKPKFFISENVKSFMNTKCIAKGEKIKIEDAFNNYLRDDYIYKTKVINFKDYGANSSRTRTLVIGVRKDIGKNTNIDKIFPTEEKEKTLKEVIGFLPSLNTMGEIDKNDIFHNFKRYREDMRKWITDIKQGESAFDNEDINKKPHKIVDGKLVINAQKNGDKYTRQRWDKVAPCIHTRNDILASQNTIHPVDDRVFSIRELMLMMNIPKSFKWTDIEEKDLNKMTNSEKKKFLKDNEMNIRQSIGEAIPTIIIQKVACNIKRELEKGSFDK